MINNDSADVLVVGAGPAGLTTAIELARRSVNVRIIDKAPAPNDETRALGMQARTLEHFRRVGIADELLDNGLRAARFHVYSEGRPILYADFSGLDSAYPFLLMIPQDRVEAILTATLTRYGVKIERQVALTDLHQTQSGVHTVLEHADGSTERADVGRMVGADGAHSTVRRQLGLDFVGTSFEENFTVADLRVDWEYPADEFFAFLDRGRFVAMFPMLGGWHRVAIARPVGDPRTGAVTTEELQQALDNTVPDRPRIVQVRQAGRFRINQRRASSYSAGRVFLAGDAAHIHSVVGAQGMNSGIQDAFNLGWKLAAVINSEAPISLLDSYGAERTPVAQRLVSGTLRITRVTLLKDPIRTWLRRHVAPLIINRARQRLLRAVAQLDVSYHDGSGAAPAGRAEIGDRAPDAPLADGSDQRSRVHELLDGLDHTLLCFDLPDDRVQQTVARITTGGHGGLHVALLSGERAAAEAYRLDGPGAVLIRPDGYIAERFVS